MGAIKKTLATLAAASMLIGGGVVTAAPAAAAPYPWIEESDVARATNTGIGAARDNVGRGTIQVRHGVFNGTRYGWARVLNGAEGRWLLLEVDTNGDRVVDDFHYRQILTSNRANLWTHGYPTSSSSARAFRACVVPDFGQWCVDSPSYRTSWW